MVEQAKLADAAAAVGALSTTPPPLSHTLFSPHPWGRQLWPTSIKTMKTRKIAPTSKTAAPANENCGNKNKNRKGKKGKERARSTVRYPLLRFNVCMVKRGIFSFFHTFIHLFKHWFTCQFIRIFTDIFINYFIYTIYHLFIDSFTHSFMHALIPSFMHSFIHSRVDHLGISCNPGQYTLFLQQIEGYKKRNKEGVKIPKQQQSSSEEKGRVKWEKGGGREGR